MTISMWLGRPFRLGKRSDFLPNARDHLSGLIQPHLPVHHVAEQEQPRLDDNGHEVGARLRVVVPLQPKRAAVTAARVIGLYIKACAGILQLPIVVPYLGSHELSASL